MDILVLEDSLTDQEAIRRVLLSAGISESEMRFVTSVADAEPLLPACDQSCDHFLFLCDLNVDDSDTDQTVGWLLKKVRCRTIIMTGGDPTIQTLSVLYGFANYLVAYVNKGHYQDLIQYLHKPVRLTTAGMQRMRDVFSCTGAKLLLVEDNPDDALLVLNILEKAGVVRDDVKHVTTLSEAKQQISDCDRLVADLTLPDSPAVKTLKWVLFEQSRPTVIVTDHKVSLQELLAVFLMPHAIRLIHKHSLDAIPDLLNQTPRDLESCFRDLASRLLD